MPIPIILACTAYSDWVFRGKVDPMPVTIPEKPKRPSFRRRLGWFVLLYAGGVAAAAVVAYGLKLWIKP